MELQFAPFAERVNGTMFRQENLRSRERAMVLSINGRFGSFVRECDNGIVAGGAKSGIDGASCGSNNREKNRAKNPLIGDLDLESGNGFRENSFGKKRETNASETTDDGEHERFT